MKTWELTTLSSPVTQGALPHIVFGRTSSDGAVGFVATASDDGRFYQKALLRWADDGGRWPDDGVAAGG